MGDHGPDQIAPGELFQRAVAAHREGDFTAAVEICDELLARAGDQPEALNLKAVACAEGGRLVRARESILAALRSTDTETSGETRALLHVHAARILAALDLYRDARDHARRAAGLRPADPGCAYQYARLALLAGDAGQARELVRDCLQRFPGFIEARMLACQMAMEAGDLEAAEAELEAVIDQDPRHARALSGLAAIRKSLPGDVGTDLWAIYDGGPESEKETGDWASAAFALADSHARAGAYREAFEFYRDANRHLAARSAWDMPSWLSRVDETLYAAAPIEPAAGRADGPQPVFIVGMPRSGSSLLERILGAHSQVAMGGERASLSHIERHLDSGAPGLAAAGTKIPDQDAGELAELYRAGMYPTPEASWVTDKANRNFERLGLAMRLFPASRVIWILRHPLDAILSCFFKDFQHGLGFTHSLTELAWMYRMHLRLMEKWTECFGKSILPLSYSELVLDTKTVVRRLCDFLELDFQSAMLEPHRQPDPVRTASTLQVQKPIHDRSLGRWRNYEAELTEIIEDLRRHGIIGTEGEAVNQIGSGRG